jgi:hypothetical protein
MPDGYFVRLPVDVARAVREVAARDWCRPQDTAALPICEGLKGRGIRDEIPFEIPNSTTSNSL